MADIKVTGATFTVNAANDYLLGDAHHADVSAMLVELVSDSFVGSITVTGRALGSSAAFVAIPYRPKHLNGVVGDNVPVGTAITDTSVILIDAAGMEIDIDCTAYTSGSMAGRVIRLVGCATG
jgi:hypothetical protein